MLPCPAPCRLLSGARSIASVPGRRTARACRHPDKAPCRRILPKAQSSPPRPQAHDAACRFPRVWQSSDNGGRMALQFLLVTSFVRSAMISRSEEHTSELQSLMRISYAVFCLKKKNKTEYT